MVGNKIEEEEFIPPPISTIINNDCRESVKILANLATKLCGVLGPDLLNDADALVVEGTKGGAKMNSANSKKKKKQQLGLIDPQSSASRAAAVRSLRAVCGVLCEAVGVRASRQTRKEKDKENVKGGTQNKSKKISKKNDNGNDSAFLIKDAVIKHVKDKRVQGLFVGYLKGEELRGEVRNCLAGGSGKGASSSSSSRGGRGTAGGEFCDSLYEMML